MSIFWKVTISAIATYQLVLTFWVHRAAEAVYGMLSNSRMSFEETGPDEMHTGLLGWAAAHTSICLVTALVSRWWAAAVVEPNRSENIHDHQTRWEKSLHQTWSIQRNAGPSCDYGLT